MSTTYDLNARRRPTTRTWLALGAAATAVVVLVALIAVACAGRGGSVPTGLGPSATPSNGYGVGGEASPGDPAGDGGPGGGGPGGNDPGDPGDPGGPGGPGDDGDGEEGNGGQPDPGLPALAGYEVVRKEVNMAGGAFLRDTVACPSGKVAVGGGAQVVGAGSDEFQTVIQESTPSTVGGGAQSQWLVAVRNAAVQPRTLGIAVVCADPPAGYEVVNVDVPVPVGDYGRRGARCPVGAVVLGGGASVIGAGTGNFGTIMQESAPGSAGSQAQWLVSIRNSGGEDRTVRIRAVCADPLAGHHVVAKTVSVAADGYQRTAVLCPVGMQVLGGGASVVGAGTGNFLTALRESGPGTTGSPQQSTWLVSIRNGGAVNRDVGLRAVCLAAQ